MKNVGYSKITKVVRQKGNLPNTDRKRIRGKHKEEEMDIIKIQIDLVLILIGILTFFLNVQGNIFLGLLFILFSIDIKKGDN